MKKIKFRELDTVTKILVILFIAVVFYFAVFSLLKPFFITQPTPALGMMSQIMGSDMMNFSGGASTAMNIAALLAALGIAIVVSFYLFQHSRHGAAKATEATEGEKYRLVRKGLSQDEKNALDEIKKAREITQDSLRFRLNWSKAKTSTILTNLDRAGFIQRERIGKTYKVYLQNI